MIDKLHIQNFKCFRDSPTFEFSKINLLTGINGRGKSSLLQSLLLLSQSYNRNNDFKELDLNGKYVNLGTYTDIKNSETPRGENIVYELHVSKPYPEIYIKIAFCENELNPLVASKALVDISVGSSDKLKFLNQKLEEISAEFGVEAQSKFNLTYTQIVTFGAIIAKVHYIGADRMGPVKYVEKLSLPDFLNVGAKGENTISILAKEDLPLVHDNLYLGNDSKSVIQQTQEWLSYILDGAKIEIKGKEKESSILYMLLNNRNNAYNYKPTNVGFGYSYILPLIVSGLIAKEGEIIIIENPEAHLHPKAQSRIIEFFAKVASTGVQVFIESHSEHILNGLRVCALNPDIAISNTDLNVLYFNDSFESEKLQILENGKIPNWPDGFFDQQELDLAEIFKYSRKP